MEKVEGARCPQDVSFLGPSSRLRRSTVRSIRIRAAALTLLVSVLLGYVYPISSFFTRAGTVLCLLVFLTLIGLETWQRGLFRFVLVGCITGALLAVVVLGCQYAAMDLRDAYVRELFLYDGPRDVWGGEVRFC